SDRFANCVDDGEIGQAFNAGRFDRFIIQDTVGKMDQLGRELIAFAVGRLLRFLVLNRKDVLQVTLKAEGRIELEVAQRPENMIGRGLVLTKAAGELCETIFWKAHNGRNHFWHLAEARIVAALSEGRNFQRLGLENITSRINTVYA